MHTFDKPYLQYFKGQLWIGHTQKEIGEGINTHVPEVS